jgi:predicted RNase H-like HicB family nuclease
MPNLSHIFAEPSSSKYEIDLPWLSESDWQHGANLSRTIVPDWQEKLPVAIEAFYQSILSKWNFDVKIKAFEREIAILQSRISTVESQQPVVIPIATLSPEPFDVIKPFQVVIRPFQGEYIASFFDASINASGETIDEAYLNLKEIIVSTFEMLLSHKPAELGPIPLRQLAVLSSFIKSASE